MFIKITLLGKALIDEAVINKLSSKIVIFCIVCDPDIKFKAAVAWILCDQ